MLVPSKPQDTPGGQAARSGRRMEVVEVPTVRMATKEEVIQGTEVKTAVMVSN